MSTTSNPAFLSNFDLLSVSAFECNSSIKRTHLQPAIGYVRRGSMTYRPWGRGFDLVPGSFLIGRPGMEYFCEHDTGASGIGLSFRFSSDHIDATGYEQIPARCGYVAPVAELAILGELAQSAAEGNADVGLDEIGIVLAHRLAAVVTNHDGHRQQSLLRHRRRIIDIALWIDEHLATAVNLRKMAGLAEMSPYHFLRSFTAIIGVTPHQYLIRCRLRRAAKLLAESVIPVTEIALDVGFADLSNFTKAFRRAAGTSPQRFREVAHGRRRLA